MKNIQVLKILALILFCLALAACRSPEIGPEWRVFFTNINDGDTVDSPVTVQWSAENFIIEPAGEVRDGAGHLHIMVNVPCIPAGEIILADDNHLHYGMGQTEATLELPPGEYTLCLQAGDGIHAALPGDGATHVVRITVR
jgi:hypothetical protein